MKIYTYLSLILLVISTAVMASDSITINARTGATQPNTWNQKATVNINKVPKQYSLEAGYSNLFIVMDNSDQYVNQSTHGYGFLFDYAWQLSGLTGKKPAAFITVPMGFTFFLPNNSSSKQIMLWNYGWTVRHELKQTGKVTPFVGYGLLLNRLYKDDEPGAAMGHQTQFEFGVNFNTPSRLKYFAKVQTSYTSYPRLGQTEKIHLMFADLRFGVRF